MAFTHDSLNVKAVIGRKINVSLYNTDASQAVVSLAGPLSHHRVAQSAYTSETRKPVVMFECQVALTFQASDDVPQYKGPRVDERSRPSDGMVVDIAEGLAVGGGTHGTAVVRSETKAAASYSKARPLTWF